MHGNSSGRIEYETDERFLVNQCPESLTLTDSTWKRTV